MVVNEKMISRLNSLLRGEISAVESYRLAADKLTNPQHRVVLDENLRSHQMRVNQLRDFIVQLGGQPSGGAGAWGAVTRLWTGGAALLGDGPLISALEEGEEQGMRDYRDPGALADLDRSTLSMVTNQLQPEQQRTHRALTHLKQQVSA